MQKTQNKSGHSPSTRENILIFHQNPLQDPISALSASHVIIYCDIGIQGNEMVDKQAKTSLSLEPTSFKIPFFNFKPSINKYILEEWQTS